MKIWTYLEMNKKLTQDVDINDELFTSPDEITGYFNEALAEAEAEIIETNQDYLRTKGYVPLVAGQRNYVLPDNIYANKIRAVMYANGSVIYPVVRYRRRNEFQNIQFTEQYGTPDDYRYILSNDLPGQAYMEIHPASRETAIMPPSATPFTPMTMWYIRNCARVPILGEYCNPEVVAPSQVNTGANSITVNSGTQTYGIKSQGQVGCYPGSITYVTGDEVQLSPGPTGTLPGGLSINTTYWVIALGPTSIQLATSQANADNSVPITISSQGTVFFTIQVACTLAIKNATLIDIPEFATFVMQWVKCRVLAKERSPTVEMEAQLLAQQKKQMVDTLTNSVPDDDDEIQADFSSYQEMS